MRRAIGLIAASALLASLASLAPGPATAPACAAGSGHASVVVQHGDGWVLTRCVAFSGSGASGEQLLNASGISWSGQTFGGYGVAVCAVDGEPARYSSCPGADMYWAVFVSRGGGAWQLSAVGVSGLTLADGDALGLHYVPTSGTPAPPPVAPPCPAAATATATTPAVSGGPGATPTVPAAGATVDASTAGATAGTTAATGTTAGTTAATGTTAGTTAAAIATICADATGPIFCGSTPAELTGSSTGGSGGPDLGLLAAAIAAGGLGGLVVLRLVAARRPRR